MWDLPHSRSPVMETQSSGVGGAAAQGRGVRIHDSARLCTGQAPVPVGLFVFSTTHLQARAPTLLRCAAEDASTLLPCYPRNSWPVQTGYTWLPGVWHGRKSYLVARMWPG